MKTINQIKQLAETDTPLLFFECTLPSGAIEYWSTHSLVFNGQQYQARVLRHNLFDLQLSAGNAMDGISQLSITLANADSAISELNAAIGLKGTQLSVQFAFADLTSSLITTESTILFRGIAGDPDEITEDSLTLTFTNKLCLQRIPLPEVRIQRSCPWAFPSSINQRTEAVAGGAASRYSRFYRCGYSADIAGGAGNLNSGLAFTSCNKSRGDCQARGMFGADTSGHSTRRFGGFEFVPSQITVRTAGKSTTHLSPLEANTAKYNDAVPIVYGTGWIKAPISFARNDGNLTHIEVLLGMGTIEGVLKVVVNDVELPVGVSGQDMTVTGWYSVVTTGAREGAFNLDFTDSAGDPLGDPYGSIAVLSIIVPNRIASGRGLPNVEVLLQGMHIDSYNPDGTFQTTGYSNNPAWVILDILQRSGWSPSDINLPMFASSAAYCAELIATTDLNGRPIQVPRFQCNLVLTKRQSAAVVIRGIRVASSLMLRYEATGLLELLPETTIALQQPALPDGSNATEQLQGGWPAYEFSDASALFSGIVRSSNGASTVRLSSRGVAETSNRLSVEFQDESNEYQQDSLSLADADDAALIGYEISSYSTALGLANFSQATRVLLRQLDQSTKGNLFVEFQTSFRALKVRPGDIITLTYLKENFVRKPFRVVKLSPSLNYQIVTVLAQAHDDGWYSDSPAMLGGAGRQPEAQTGAPRPLIGLLPHNDANGKFEFFDFEAEDQLQVQAGGAATDLLTVSFSQPSKPHSNSPSLPLVGLSPEYVTGSGTLPAGAIYYYAVTAVDAAGNEGALSFTIRAAIPSGSSSNSVTITGLSFPVSASAFHVYRGAAPQRLYRIASSVPLPADRTFTDSGLPPQPIGPPDANFDHANFYYRFEHAGPFSTTIASATTIGSDGMGATNRAYAGMVVRIIEGTGRGQERSIATNNATTLTVTPAWSVTPDTTSIFVIAENSWSFAAVSATTPARFEVPYETSGVIQISGRGANVQDQEGDPELCPLTRWTLGGQQSNSGVPAAPAFSLDAPGAGEMTVSQIGFTDLTNVGSIATGTLQVFYWNELQTPTAYSLAAALDASSTTVQLTAIDANAASGSAIQVDGELMFISETNPSANAYTVSRGALQSTAATHNTGAGVLHLSESTLVLPFAAGFFDSRSAGNYLATFDLPDTRISAATFFVTNSFGNSQPTQHCYTAGADMGLRTLSGGQFSLQVNGVLATQTNAAPPLVIEASHAIRDIRATVGQAPAGSFIGIGIFHNGTEYCNLTINAGSTTSTVVAGTDLSPLTESALLTLNVTLNMTDPTVFSPGRDLTVTIRL
ncbi:MAG TPA: phage tail protein [Bryobacteraceae bacterium]